MAQSSETLDTIKILWPDARGYYGIHDRREELKQAGL